MCGTGQIPLNVPCDEQQMGKIRLASFLEEVCASFRPPWLEVFLRNGPFFPHCSSLLQNLGIDLSGEVEGCDSSILVTHPLFPVIRSSCKTEETSLDGLKKTPRISSLMKGRHVHWSCAPAIAQQYPQ